MGQTNEEAVDVRVSEICPRPYGADFNPEFKIFSKLDMSAPVWGRQQHLVYRRKEVYPMWRD